jgi:prepilin-type N-terminal cleavage/methylation domain-containing protein
MRAINTRNQAGFTLIELMIVVGIIGILVAIAAPNFAKYQSKARQSEAKIALSAIYGAEKSFYSEYAAYSSGMDAVGYAPEGNKRFYNVGFNATITTSVTGWGDTQANLNKNSNIAIANNPFTCTSSTYYLGNLDAATDPQSFNANASGCIRDGAALHDSWSINDTKIIRNVKLGL